MKDIGQFVSAMVLILAVGVPASGEVVWSQKG